MSGSHRIAARLFLVAASAVLTLSMPVVAQIPSTSGSAPASQQTAETEPLLPGQVRLALQYAPPGFLQDGLIALAHVPVGIAERFSCSAIPGLHLSATILAGGDLTLEAGIIDWVILDVNGHAPVGQVEGWTLRDRPTPEDAVMLKSKSQ